MRADRFLTLLLLLGLFALPVVPTMGPMRCLIPEAPRTAACRGMATERCGAPVSFALGLAFDRAQRSTTQAVFTAPRVATTRRPTDEFLPSPWVRQLPSRPLSLLSVWRI